MRHEIRHNPDFAMVRVAFDHPGESLVTEAGAMVAKDTAISMKTNVQGGVAHALTRKLLSGETLFQNTYTATAPGQTMWFAPAPEGAIECVQLEPGMEVFLQSGAYVASTEGVSLDTAWAGAKGFFAGGLFLLRAYGQGLLWFSSFGAIHSVDVGTRYSGYVCDNTHLVAFSQGLTYSVRKLGGIKGLLLSGEGLICEFQGQGRLWLQTRNPGALAAFLHPFRGVKSH